MYVCMYVYDLFFNLAFFFFLLILPSSMFFTVIVFLVLSFWGEKEPFQFLNKNAHLFCNLKKKKEICVFKLELEYIYIYIYIYYRKLIYVFKKCSTFTTFSQYF